jgi:hypothetical protein
MSESDEQIRSDIRALYSKSSGKPLSSVDPAAAVPAPIEFYEGELKGSTSKKSYKARS